MKIKDFQKEEKPREKLIEKGVENLTDVELLAIILRSGGEHCPATTLARDLLNKYSGFKNLINSDIEELKNFKNVGDAKATGIKAVGEISKRMLGGSEKAGKTIKKPQDVFDLVRKDTVEKEQEYLFLITLNSKSKVISKDLISKGTLTETLIHPREVFKKALAKNASSIILVHNHPSGEAQPSLDDIKVTKRIAKTGIEIGIPLVDHLIVTDSDFTSMKAQGLFSI